MMHQTGTLAVNGADMYYEIRGDGHPIVLVHAGIADSRMWDDQMDVFAARYTVVRYDLRGYGRSSMPPEPAAYYEDLHGLMRALGLERAHLVGVSIGGGIVIDFCLAYPEMTTALIPVGPGLGGFEAEPTPAEMALFEEGEAAFKAGEIDRANEIDVRIWVDGPGRVPEQVDPRARARVREMNAATFAHQAEHEAAGSRPLEPPAAGRLGEIRVPTLAIVGDQDVSPVQGAVDKIAAEVPGARKAVIHDAGHVPNMERPEEFNRLVLDFLGGL